MCQLESLYRRHRTRLWRLAIRLTGEPDAAQDLVQDTFVRAASRRLPARASSAEAWLVRTLVNLSHDRYRKMKVGDRQEPVFERARPKPGNPEGAAVAKATLGRVLKELSARARAVLLLRELEGLSFAEIARLLGVRQVTARWHLARARKHLVEALGRDRRNP